MGHTLKWLWVVGLVLVTTRVEAQPASEPEAPAAPEPSAAPEATREPVAPPEMAEAKELFRKGNELRRAGDCQQALVYFTRSRRAYPSVANTVNGAYCLSQLERLDEALEMAESALIDFASELTPEQREMLGPTIRSLRKRVGSLEVQSNVSGMLVIDGRHRGTLPLAGPVRVLPGKRKIRIVKDGYRTYETELGIVAEQTSSVDAKLEPLARSGLLRASAPEAVGARLFVDGALVGELPWTGQLAPGRHLVVAQLGDRGTGPSAVEVVAGQEVAVAPRLAPLGPTVRILAAPEDATLTIDGVRVDPGGWQGRLPVGQHSIRVMGEGYLEQRHTLVVTEAHAGDLDIKLVADKNHPRWSAGKETSLELATAELARQLAAKSRRGPSGEAALVGVLTFGEVGGTAREKHLGTVVAELVATRLSETHGIQRLDRSRTEAVLEKLGVRQSGKSTGADATQLQQELGTQIALTGTVAEAGAHFLITANLMDLSTGAVLVSAQARVRRAELVTVAEESIVQRTRAGAVYRALLPGWGQFYNGPDHRAKGYVIAFGSLATGAAAVTMFVLADRAEQRVYDYDTGGTVTGVGITGRCPSSEQVDPEAYEYCAEKREELSDRANAYRTIGYASAVGFGALYLWGVIDAAAYGEDYLGVEVSTAPLQGRSLGDVAGGMARMRVSF